MPPSCPPEVSVVSTHGATVDLMAACGDWVAVVCDRVLTVYRGPELVDCARLFAKMSCIRMTVVSPGNAVSDDVDGRDTRGGEDTSEETRSSSCPILLGLVGGNDVLQFWQLDVTDGEEEGCGADTEDGNNVGGKVARMVKLPEVELPLIGGVSRAASHLSFDASALLVALCRGQEVEIVERLSGRLFDRLAGQHRLPVTCAAFGMSKQHMLFSCSEDGSFVCWDLQKHAVAYRSSVICSTSPLIGLCLSSTVDMPDTLAVASADGRLWIYDVLDSGHARELHHCNLTSEINRLRLKMATTRLMDERQSYSDYGDAVDVADGDFGKVELSAEPLALAHICSPHQQQVQLSHPTDNAAIVDGKMVERSYSLDKEENTKPPHVAGYLPNRSRGHLVVVTPSALLRIDCRSFNVEALLCLGGQWGYGVAASPASPRAQFGLASRAAVSSSLSTCPENEGRICAAMSTAFASEVIFFDTHSRIGNSTIPVVQADRDGDGVGASEVPLSLFPRVAREGEGLKMPVFPRRSPLEKDATARPVNDMYKGILGVNKKGHLSRGSERRGKTTKEVRDQPVTFHSKVKSSGYGTAPTHSGMFQGSRRPAKGVRRRLDGSRSDDGKASDGGNGGAAATLFTKAESPVQWALPTEYQPLHDIVSLQQAHHPGAAAEARAKGVLSPVGGIRFSGNSKLMGVAYADASISVYRLPISKHFGRSSSYLGHDAAVSSVCFSHSTGAQAKILSSSADGSSRLWLLNKPEAPLVITVAGSGEGNTRTTSSAPTPSLNKVHGMQRKGSLPQVLSRNGTSEGRDGNRSSSFFPPAILQQEGRGDRRHSDGRNAGVRPGRGIIATSPRLPSATLARFFYLDRFIVLACNGWVRMLTYRLDGLAANDLTRLKGGGQATVAHSWASGATAVTSLDCVNSFLSPMIVVATSNRSVLLLDAAVGRIARVINDAHTRPAHSVVLPGPTAMDCLPQSAVDVFLTSAADSTVKMWDVRESRCVGRFSAHVNNREQVGVAFSPCMRWIASGSEDKNAYIWDVRTGSLMAKLGGHTDVVSDVAFNGRHSQLTTASFDGTLLFYKS